MPGPRDYKTSTTRRLYVLSGGKCSSPDCDNSLVARDKKTIISKICHIEAAEPGGARYNVQMTDNDRRHFDNLILLCDACHSIIDNPENEQAYPKTLLVNWKKDHEATVISELSRKPSLLIDAIQAISSIDFDEESHLDEGELKAFSIEDKITQNSIKRNKALIEEYKIFYAKISSLYDELESQGSFKKSSLLKYINSLYLKVKGEYVGNSNNSLEIIQANSDNIIEDVREIISERVHKESKKISSEEIEFGIDIIVVDAFIRCKILESPK